MGGLAPPSHFPSSGIRIVLFDIKGGGRNVPRSLSHVPCERRLSRSHRGVGARCRLLLQLTVSFPLTASNCNWNAATVTNSFTDRRPVICAHINISQLTICVINRHISENFQYQITRDCWCMLGNVSLSPGWADNCDTQTQVVEQI